MRLIKTQVDFNSDIEPNHATIKDCQDTGQFATSVYLLSLYAFHFIPWVWKPYENLQALLSGLFCAGQTMLLI